MFNIIIRDKSLADEDNSPYLVLVARNSTSYVAYETIEEFMAQWHDTLYAAKLTVSTFSQRVLVLMSDYIIYDVYEYSKGLTSAIKNGARECQLLSNGSMMPGAILVDATNKQTTFFRLNPNDKVYKRLDAANKLQADKT